MRFCTRFSLPIWVRAVFALGALLATVGCGDGRPTRVPVSGRVLIDGKPLSYGVVTFIPSDARSSYGRLDNEGRFTLSCFSKDDGVVTGKHKVAVCAGETIGEDHLKWHAPKVYADHHTSELEYEITGPTDSIVIELQWKGGRPFVE